MAVNYTDFDKIWASASPLTPYEFSENNYKAGWNFVGATPPSRQMWDAFMKNADEKLQYLYNHESVPVGHEYFTFNPNVPQGSLPLFGGEYSRETYSALWNWVQQQTGYLKTEAEWQQIYTTNAGNVPYYSDGDGSTTFRVPSLRCWVKAANGTVSEVGSYLQAGLPNITGSMASRLAGDTWLGWDNGGGAFYSQGDTSSTFYESGHSKTSGKYQLWFDASRSNSIYGNSTTVQPPSIVGMWLVKAYGVVEDTGSIDEQAYIDDRFNASKQYTDDKIAPIGTTYFGEWVASSSSAIHTEVTQTINNIPQGTYLALLKVPVLSVSNLYFGLKGSGFSVVGGNGISFASLSSSTESSVVITVTNDSNSICMDTEASAICDFTNIERGGLVLVRISG